MESGWYGAESTLPAIIVNEYLSHLYAAKSSVGWVKMDRKVQKFALRWYEDRSGHTEQDCIIRQ